MAQDKAYSQRWWQDNKEWACAAARQRYWRNPEKERIRRAKQKYALKLETLIQYSVREYPICAHCGETDIRVLQIDHIDSGGSTERKVLNKHGGHGFYSWLRKQGFPEGYQVLCANCNIRKEYDTRNLYLPSEEL